MAPMEPALFTMVANSATVELFILTKYDVEYLNNALKTLLRYALQHTSDVDCPKGATRKAILEEHRAWEDQKANLVENLQRKQFLDRNKYQPEKILFDK